VSSRGTKASKKGSLIACSNKPIQNYYLGAQEGKEKKRRDRHITWATQDVQEGKWATRGGIPIERN